MFTFFHNFRVSLKNDLPSRLATNYGVDNEIESILE